jgi:hypothetical protein
VGSAIPKLCWDTTHGHTLGGGNFWATGYQAMMDAISASLYGKQQKVRNDSRTVARYMLLCTRALLSMRYPYLDDRRSRRS